MPKRKKHVKQAQAGGTQPSNTSNNLAYQHSNVSNPPQPTELLKNQSLQIQLRQQLPYLFPNKLIVYLKIMLRNENDDQSQQEFSFITIYFSRCQPKRT